MPRGICACTEAIRVRFTTHHVGRVLGASRRCFSTNVGDNIVNIFAAEFQALVGTIGGTGFQALKSLLRVHALAAGVLQFVGAFSAAAVF